LGDFAGFAGVVAAKNSVEPELRRNRVSVGDVKVAEVVGAADGDEAPGLAGVVEVVEAAEGDGQPGGVLGGHAGEGGDHGFNYAFVEDGEGRAGVGGDGEGGRVDAAEEALAGLAAGVGELEALAVPGAVVVGVAGLDLGPGEALPGPEVDLAEVVEDLEGGGGTGWAARTISADLRARWSGEVTIRVKEWAWRACAARAACCSPTGLRAMSVAP
jgi:hypothetical protein